MLLVPHCRLRQGPQITGSRWFPQRFPDRGNSEGKPREKNENVQVDDSKKKIKSHAEQDVETDTEVFKWLRATEKIENKSRDARQSV